ncbi:hypothetical protein KFL_000900120 [Klebsormidium nitens]|uniref:Glycosyl transferase CAP10 domain-containing protein n=1 Tax=Klebsormidium nitens TaxID=105231 RepID=A0A0U9HKW1_KLENI|nr:hypothetical protein KFL_000900120 [Klebsormidium nitens]|eukprot:GAQ81757.1 hypothetical protein KFL_000900120 [Klebsormidium nitens]
MAFTSGYPAKPRPYASLLVACLFLVVVVLIITLYSAAQCSFLFRRGLTCTPPETPTVQGTKVYARSDAEYVAGCARDWRGHLRTKSAPLDSQWLALHETAADVTLLGPDGTPVPLEKVGTLQLLNNTAYKFEAQHSGAYKLLVSNEPVSEFALHPSDCYCPTGFAQFLDRYECTAEMGEHVREMMARWRPGSITREMLAYPIDVQLSTHSYILQFAIINNKLYCKLQDGQNCPLPTEGFWFVGLDPQIRLIQAILRKTRIPDMLFFWNQADNPMLHHYAMQPIFSPSSAEWFADLLFPVFNMITDKFDGNDVTSAATATPWEERRDVAYFVGHLTGQPQTQAYGSHLINPRLRAAEIALERPDLLDVSVTVSEDQGKDHPEYIKELLDRGVVQKEYKQDQRGAAKYVIDLPGNSAAWRLGSRLGDGAVTLKSLTAWNEFWHYLLEPGKNILMIGEWPDDLVEKVEAAKKHDSEMRCVARAAQVVAFTRLRQEDLLCWTALNLHHLSTKYAFTPNLTISEWHEIPVEHRDPEKCRCTT